MATRGSMSAGIAGAVLALATASGPAAAQQAPSACLPQVAALAEQLGKQFGETLVSAGVDAGGSLVQVYSNKDSGTWTIAVTLPSGPTCIVSSGEGWARGQTAAAPKPGLAT